MSDKIRVSLGVTQSQDFNSIRLDASYETDVSGDETIEEAYDRAWALVDSQVEAQLSDD